MTSYFTSSYFGPYFGAVAEAEDGLSPDQPGQVTAYTTTYDGHGDVEPGVVMTFTQVSRPAGFPGSFDSYPMQAVSDEDGLISIVLLEGVKYRYRRGNGRASHFTTPTNKDYYQLPSQLGRDD